MQPIVQLPSEGRQSVGGLCLAMLFATSPPFFAVVLVLVGGTLQLLLLATWAVAVLLSWRSFVRSERVRVVAERLLRGAGPPQAPPNRRIR